MDVLIQPAGMDDLEALTALMRKYYAYDGHAFDPAKEGNERAAALYRRLGLNPRGHRLMTKKLGAD